MRAPEHACHASTRRKLRREELSAWCSRTPTNAQGPPGRRVAGDAAKRALAPSSDYASARLGVSTLLDDAYYEALVRVSEALTDAGLPFALGGWGAAQARSILRTGGGQRRFSDEPVLRSALRILAIWTSRCPRSLSRPWRC